ncbi:MAG: Rpn family recombination-promoting nuclease/putative transposase [Planctomycetaceae bacterium]|nr:MAG: Rpn family recombination-promoting nuclease/putative transposase [Planctomycetaceae bacterium]
MIIGIDPTVDFACKRLLGSPKHPAITRHFLNSMLRFPSPIREVRILNPTIEKEFADDKWSLLDILATDERGRLYDIEVQTTRPLGLRQRLAYYAASLLAGQLEAGEGYHELKPSIGICLLDAIEFREEAGMHHHFQLRTDRGQLLTDCLQIHLVELPKYVPPGDNRVITDPVEQWYYFFCRAKESTKEELAARLPHPVFAEAVGVLEMIAKNPDERRLYNARLKMERDERARNLQARLEGELEGEVKGRLEGRLEGELMGQVKLLQQLLGDSPSGTEELLSLGMQRLTALEQELQKRLRERLG